MRKVYEQTFPMIPPHNIVGWFEIPAVDMERAIKFYQAVFGFEEFHREQMGPLDMAMFPSIEGSMGAAGALIKHEQWYKPTTDGVLIYFTAFSGDVNVELGRVEAAGGHVAVPRKQIGDYGFMAVFVDTEGNRIALHSRT